MSLRLVLLALCAGCASIGPGTVARDRFDYSTAITDSWKRQILRNTSSRSGTSIPRSSWTSVRSMSMSSAAVSIVSGYTLEYGASAGGTLTSAADSVTLGGSAKYTDRPTITYVPLTGDKFAVLTRSVMQMMVSLAAHAEVPEGDVAEGRAAPGWESAEPGVESRRKFRIRCAKSRPRDAFVAVPYRGHWFWIDDTDLASKRNFAFVMFLFTLADTGDRGGQPVLTIPT